MSFPLPKNLLDLPNETVKQLMKKVALYQNGDTASTMKKLGYNYKLNYGVSIPQLKLIAQTTKPNHTLAVLLRQFYHIREALILSSMLDEPEKISQKKTVEIGKLIIYPELAQQFGKNLFPYVSPLPHLLTPDFTENNMFYALCFWSLAWALKFNQNIDNKYVELVINELENPIYYDDKSNGEVLLFLIQTMGEKNIFAEKINLLIKKMSLSSIPKMMETAEKYLWLKM